MKVKNYSPRYSAVLVRTSILAVAAFVSIHSSSFAAEAGYITPLTEFGVPDIQGTWSIATQTNLERAERFEGSEPARQLLAVLMLHRDYTAEEVLVAVELSLEHGCFDAGAISVLARQLTEPESAHQPLTDLGKLQAYDRPAASLDDYNALLTRPAVMEVH